MKCSRVHNKKSRFDVYIGRPSIWGNPFSHKEDTLAEFKTASRKESIERYREYLLKDIKLQESIRNELNGKIIACWCDGPEEYTLGDRIICHGQIIQMFLKYPDMIKIPIYPKVFKLF